MRYRFASPADVPVLAAMNEELIRDEGHHNQMTRAELERRMAGFLDGGYTAVLFEEPGAPAAGYALYRMEPGYAYLRQFFVAHEHRRRGIGRAAFNWLRENPWRERPRIRLEVLVGNQRGIRFWRSVGFEDYCLIMEAEQAALQAGASTPAG
jgi:ribosomal protein S18 acetylase RimI-like enzyme